MNPALQIIDPTRRPDWDDLLLSGNKYSFFHSSAWATVLSESYRYRPLFFTLFYHDRLLGLIPLMEVRSILTGRRGVSLPFTDECEPIIDQEGHFDSLMNHIIDYGKEKRWKTVELRGGNAFFDGIRPATWFYGHTLALERESGRTFRSFKGSTRRNIRKAIKENVRVHFSHSMQSVREFYRLNTLTRKLHGLPPQPLSFFRNVHKHIISQKKGIVVLASSEGRYIAGAVYFHFGSQAIYKYGASEREYQFKRPNNRIMWEAIKWYAEKGFESLSFGRTEPKNNGLLQFKRGWGAQEAVLRYYTYDLREGSYVADHSNIGRLSPIFRKMPAPLLNLVGSLLYRHVG